jgi:DNA-binding GntR family transcriptional regulator
MPIPPDESTITRSLLRDDVFRRLRDGIVDGTFAPGEQLRDVELAAWLGCSRTPVREALLRLADVGLVVASPGRSTVVADLDVAAVREARDVVAGMHAVAVRQAIERIGEADLDEMRAANDDFAAAVRHGDLDATHEADRRFHAVPLRIAGNSALVAVLEQYEPVLRRAEKARFAEDAGRRTIQVHADLIERFAEGDALAASILTYDTWHSLTDR